MQTVSRSNFTTVKTEGAILPADLLQRVADGDLDGMAPEAYHLAPNERPNEAINRAWNRCLGVWQSFNDQRQTLPASDSGVSLTRERWLLILFQELGFGRLPFQRRIELEDGTAYPVSHLWGQTPIHLISFRQELDRRDPTIRRSPHSLMQEFLNRSDDHLWGFVSNGLTLRLLRDNASLTRAAYLEFDLEMMMTGEVYADFSLLWLVCHQSRVEIGTQADALALASNCWLETWSQEAAAQGTRALDALRDGVQEAIEALGRGFLAHPANGELRDRLNRGDLGTQAYYRQVLRLVYRLIFLFVAEDRDLLLLPETESQIRERYSGYYALSRLRRLAEARRGGPHPDLYRVLRQLFRLLREGYAPLGLPALGSFLFSERSTPALDGADLANHDLLNAIRALAFTIEGQVRRPVDYKNLGAEELGSVYESLLELHPQLNIAAASFDLAAAAGSERKTTGSYYTPASLINSLLDSALEPVVEDRLKDKTDPAEAEKATLNIKVVDPACGSGHFLIAAANRLAVHLARVRTGDDEPSPAARREALRDVVRHCIHGVDINEMAVELCKVALWMETLDPGKPLGFLDRNIQCGNSLIGATPALLKNGIPDGAFKPITGDDKAYCSEWRKRNKQERAGQIAMTLDAQPWERLGDLAAAMASLDHMDSDTLTDVQAQESRYEELVRSTPYLYSRFWADAWCAAFVWPKKPEHQGGYAYPITGAVFRKIERNPHDVALWMKAEIEQLRDQYQFFHWHLAFPHVFSMPPADEGAENAQTGWNGGFDVVLGNPPWERIKLQEREWFAARDPDIAAAPNAAARRKLIAALPKENPTLYTAFQESKRKAEGDSHFVRDSERYPLCGRGDVNTYTIFAELSRHTQSSIGGVGIIVPSGIATDDTTKFFFQDLMDTQTLVSLYDFENRQAVFAGVHRSYKFCLLTLAGQARPVPAAEFVFFALNTGYLTDRERRFTLSASDITLLNPNTRTCPIFRSRKDAELTKAIYRRVPVLVKEEIQEKNPWRIYYLRLIHLSDHASEVRSEEQFPSSNHEKLGNRYHNKEDTFLPVYEAKLINHFDHRYSTFEAVSQEEAYKGNPQIVTSHQKSNPNTVCHPRYWISESFFESIIAKYEYDRQWLLGFRDITNNTNERTLISIIFPRIPATVKLPTIGIENWNHCYGLLANFTSFVIDYVARQKLGGTSMSFYIFKQLPVLPPDTYAQPCKWSFGQENGRKKSTHHASLSSPSPPLISWFILPRVLELTYTAWDLQPFAHDYGYQGPPFRWDEERRFLLRCELDAAYFHLYDIERDDVDYIMETFPIVKRRDEAARGQYRTKRVILEIYDDMAEAMRTGQPYQTRLDPPPADPRVAHPWDPAFGQPPEPGKEWVEVAVTDDEQQATPTEEAALSPVIAEQGEAYTVKERTVAEEAGKAEPFTLQSPQPKGKKPKKSKPAQIAQETLLEVMPAPSGPRSVRLKRAMALGNDTSPMATRELVAFLADGDSNIRWLAASSLVQRAGDESAGADTVAAIAAFLAQAEPERVEHARSEALRVLGLIAEMAEAESVRAAAREVIERE